MKALIRKRIPLRTNNLNNNSTTPLTIDSASSCGGDLNSSKVQQRDDDTQGQGQTEAAPLPETPQHTLTTEKNVEEHEPNTNPTAAATTFKSGDSSSLIRSCSTEGTTTTAQIRTQQRTIPVLRRRKRLRATRRTNNNNNNNDESDSRGEHQKTSPLEPTSHNNHSVINHSSTTDSPQIDASTASTTTTTTTTIVTKKKKKQPPQQISLRDFASQVHSQQNLNPLWRSSSSSTATTTQAGSDLPPTSSHLVALTSSAFIPEQQQEHQQQATADPPRLSSTLQFEHPVFTAQELEILSFINQKAGECLEALGFCGERFIASVGDSAQQEFCAESAQHDYEGRVGYGFGDDFGDGNEIIMQDIIDENGVVCYSNNNSNHYHHHAEELEPIIPYSQEDSQEGNNMSSFTVLCGGSITIQVTTKASALINCDKDEEGEEDKQTTTEYEIAVHAKSLDEVEVTSHFCKLYGGSTHIVFPKIVSVVMHLQLQNSEVEFVLRLDDAITKVFKAADDLVLHPFDDYRISSQSQQHSWDATQELLMMMSSLHLPPSPTASSSFRRTLSKEKFTELFQSFDVGIGGAADESHNFTCSSALAVVRASEHPDLTRMKILTSVNRLPLLPMGEKQYSGGEGEERERGDATIPDFIENVDQATWRNLIFNIGIRQRGLIDDYLSEQCNIEVLVSDDDAINNINIKSNKDRTGHASSLWLRLRNKKEDELLSLYLFVDISLPQHEVYVENLEALIGNLVEQSVINAFEDNNYFFNQHRKQRREGAHRHHHHHQEESGNKNKKRSINPEDHKLETLLLPSICASLHSIILTSTNPHFQQECARLLSLHPAAEMEQGQDAHSAVYTATADDLERRIREVVNDTYQRFNGSRLSTTTTTTTTNRKKSTKKKKTAKQQQQQQQQSQQPHHQMGDQQQQQYHPEARQVPQKQEQEQQQDGLHSQQQQRKDTPQPHGNA